MSNALRQIAHARRTIPAVVQEALHPLEASSHQNAVLASAFATLLLTSHSEAALPLAVGADAIRLAQDVSKHAAETRAKLAALHDELKAIGYGFFPMSAPDCPPNEGALIEPLRVVG